MLLHGHDHVLRWVRSRSFPQRPSGLHLPFSFDRPLMNEEPRFQPEALFIDVLRKEKQKSEYDMRTGNKRLK